VGSRAGRGDLRVVLELRQPVQRLGQVPVGLAEQLHGDRKQHGRGRASRLSGSPKASRRRAASSPAGHSALRTRTRRPSRPRRSSLRRAVGLIPCATASSVRIPRGVLYVRAGKAAHGRRTSVPSTPTTPTRTSRRCVEVDGFRRAGLLDRPVALAEVHACGDLAHDDRGDNPVDDHAERRPPSGVGDEVASVLPEVLEPVPHHAGHEQPR
jgi:hypothetical protein